MLEFPHAMVGAAIATAIPNPLISVPLALASHFITDYVPHWNPHIHTEKKRYGHVTKKSILILTVDAGLALFFGLWLASNALPNSTQALNIVLCCLASVAPDVAEIPYYFSNIRIAPIERLLSWQRQHQWNVPMIWGLLSQLLVVLFGLLVIFT